MTRRHARARALPAAALAAGLLLSGCGGEDADEAQDPVAGAEETTEDGGGETADEPEDIDDGTSGDRPAHEAAEVLENPEEFEGEELTVGAVVDEVVSENMFLIASSDADQRPLPVLHDGELTVDEGMEVEVSGTVRQSFEVDEAEAFLGGDFDDDAHTGYEGETYLQADGVEQLD